jgi:hypothetical protein
MKIANRARNLTRLTRRERIAAAFAKIVSAVDPRTAHARTKDFYRSSGKAWARSLT